MRRMPDFNRYDDTSFIGEADFRGMMIIMMMMTLMMMTMMAVNKLWDIWFSIMTFTMAMVNVLLMIMTMVSLILMMIFAMIKVYF